MSLASESPITPGNLVARVVGRVVTLTFQHPDAYAALRTYDMILLASERNGRVVIETKPR